MQLHKSEHLSPNDAPLKDACDLVVLRDSTCGLCNIVNAHNAALCGAHEAAVGGEPNGEDLGVLWGGVSAAAALRIVQPL